jgi:hypothetical protein
MKEILGWGTAGGLGMFLAGLGVLFLGYNLQKDDGREGNGGPIRRSPRKKHRLPL